MTSTVTPRTSQLHRKSAEPQKHTKYYHEKLTYIATHLAQNNIFFQSIQHSRAKKSFYLTADRANLIRFYRYTENFNPKYHRKVDPFAAKYYQFLTCGLKKEFRGFHVMKICDSEVHTRFTVSYEDVEVFYQFV